jgi:hypothetical protein
MHGQGEVLNIFHTVQEQLPDTSKPWTQSEERSFHTDQREFDALIQVNTLTMKVRSDMKKAVRI